MSDEKFEEFLEREASAYNTPPSGGAPREERWQVIAAARAGRRATGGTPAAQPITGRSNRWRIAPWIGMAATLLIGVGIGRYALNSRSDEPTPATSSTVASATPPFTEVPAVTPESSASAAAAPVAAPAAGSTAVTPRRFVTSGAPPARFVSLPSAGTLDPNTPMQVASREHLVRAEALISVVAASAADLAIDSLTSRWARDMLSTTRLLLDSPAGEDPTRRLLLEDLETVLVLLVQRSGAPADERALLDRSLERTQLLTRLRTNAIGL